MGLDDSIPVVSITRTTTSSTGLSSIVDLGGTTLVGVYISTNTHVGTVITFQTAPTSSQTFLPIKNSTGGATSITGISTQAAQYYGVPSSDFLGVRWLKLLSTSTQDATTYTLACRPYGIS